jgi:hypothetical protein
VRLCGLSPMISANSLAIIGLGLRQRASRAESGRWYANRSEESQNSI